MTPVDDPNLLQVVLRLTAAAVIGLLLGLNRELKGKPAGLRTHALVSLGAALLALTSLHMPMGSNAGDPLSRVMQGVITGIGFLGAGVIIQGRSGNVKGLTTAAMVWVAAALGLACGAGYWVAVISTTILVFLVMMLEGLEKPLRRALGVKAPPFEGGESDGEGPEEGDAKARDARDRAF
jgi:putative Mg2+ transporter-C (MgtC) family protein